MKLYFKGIWTGILLTYIFCNELAIKLLPKAAVLSWITRHIFVFILVTIDILLTPIMAMRIVIKRVLLGRYRVEEENSKFLKERLESDILSDQAREVSIELVQNLLDEI